MINYAKQKSFTSEKLPRSDNRLAIIDNLLEPSLEGKVNKLRGVFKNIGFGINIEYINNLKRLLRCNCRPRT